MSEARSDLQTIKDWFAAISTDDFFALPPRKGRSTASAGHEEADEILDEHDLEPGEASYSSGTPNPIGSPPMAP